ncbi:GNAT family N-acetyltransferase [Promicromonospora sukumoe]
MEMTLVRRGPVDDAALSTLHARAFESLGGAVTPWSARLERHSLTWVTAADRAGDLVGFVNVIGDGGVHAVLLDTVVEPGHQGQGVGRALVAEAAAAARDLGCEWLHVDFEADRAGFYLEGCGFRTTAAGLMRLA